MSSNSSNDSDSEVNCESLNSITNKKKKSRTGLSRGERNKRSLEDSEDSVDNEDQELTSANWNQPTLGVTPSMYLMNDDSEAASKMNFELDDDSDLDDDDLEDGDLLDSPFGLGNANFCWPPPGVESVTQGEDDRKAKGGKKRKPGIIYLSSIPNGYNVSRTTGFFSQFGRVGRVFLQPDLKERSKRKDKLARNFTEGWVEFNSKRVAKDVATNLNLTQVGGKKRAKSHDVTWNIKYLPGFKWTNLSERLAYEKAVHQQRMRTEISQAKRETDFFRANVERSKRLNTERMEENADASLPVAKKSRKTVNTSLTNPTSKRIYEFRQKETDETIKKRKRLEEAQKNLTNPPHETRNTKDSIHTDKIKKPVKETKNTKREGPPPKATVKADKRKNKTKNQSKEVPLSNELDKSSNPCNSSKLKTRKASNAEKKVCQGSTDRSEFLKNVFL